MGSEGFGFRYRCCRPSCFATHPPSPFHLSLPSRAWLVGCNHTKTVFIKLRRTAANQTDRRRTLNPVSTFKVCLPLPPPAPRPSPPPACSGSSPKRSPRRRPIRHGSPSESWTKPRTAASGDEQRTELRQAGLVERTRGRARGKGRWEDGRLVLLTSPGEESLHYTHKTSPSFDPLPHGRSRPAEQTPSTLSKPKPRSHVLLNKVLACTHTHKKSTLLLPKQHGFGHGTPGHINKEDGCSEEMSINDFGYTLQSPSVVAYRP